MKNRSAMFLLAGLLAFTSFVVSAKADEEVPALPDFAVTGMSVRAKAGVNAGNYLYVTIANSGASVTSANFLSATITGLEPLGLPDGFVLYLNNEKTDAGYVYDKGYKKEFIGPRVDGAGIKYLTPVVTIDPGNYFAEIDRSNNVYSKTVLTTAASSAAVADGKAVYESGKNLTAILTNTKKKKNVALQTTAMKTYTEPLVSGTKISTAEKYAINNFIVYGSSATKTKTQAQRAAAVKTYIANFKKIPVSALDWQDVVVSLTVK